MRSRANRARGVITLAAALTFAALPPALMALILKAEGPLGFSIAFQLLSAFGLFYAARVDSGFLGGGLGRSARLAIALVPCSVAALLALVQLNVAQRSLAEAWLALAREGRAFGFFSFFATELYALFCLGASALLASRGVAAGSVALASATILSYGVVAGRGEALAVSALLTLSLPVFLPEGTAIVARLRIRAAALPALAAVVLSAPLAFIGPGSDSGPLLRPLDLRPLALRLAPAFPLLLDVPGYGWGIGAERLERNIYLSDGVLFDAEGDGPRIRYLASATFGLWTGSGWRETDEEGTELPLYVSAGAEAGAEARGEGILRLVLRGDFYSRVPLEQDTVAVQLSRAADGAEASRERGLRFPRSAERGLVADLIPGKANFGAGPEAPPPPVYLETGSEPSARLVELAEKLREKAEAAGSPRDAPVSSELRDLAFAGAALDYLSDGFVYSLRTGSPFSGEYSLDSFLFEDKSGFCVHFASAFVLLCRSAGIPARLVEGFRLTLDEAGRGKVRGVDSHAWAEAWIGGRWTRWEPTPPFASEDPFSFVRSGDRESGRQLRAVFGMEGTGRKEVPGASGAPLKSVFLPPVVGAALVCLAVFLIAPLIKAARDPGFRLRRRAARLVRRCRSRGLLGPETIGWSAWAREAVAFEPSAAVTAEAMLSLAFDRND